MPAMPGLSRIKTAVGIAALVLLGACRTEQLPIGAELTISPESRTIDIVEQRDLNDVCLLNADNHVDIPLVMALRDGQGSPIGRAEISVYVDFAANTYSGFPALALYDDREGNSNGVVDSDSELISDANDAIAIVRTGRFGGDRVLLLRVNLSCAYRGTVFAFVDETRPVHRSRCEPRMMTTMRMRMRIRATMRTKTKRQPVPMQTALQVLIPTRECA